MNKKTRYAQVLQELKRECGMLMAKYAPKLHKASHDDQLDEDLSHMYMVRKIQEDCSRVCTEATHGITFIGDDEEEEVIAAILECNYDEREVEHMIKEEGINLFSHLQMVNQGCIKRSILNGPNSVYQNCYRMEKLILVRWEASGLSSARTMVNRYTFQKNRIET